ncbi:MAG: hypothetical protein AAGF12_16915 [Myxococcota bacterium]
MVERSLVDFQVAGDFAMRFPNSTRVDIAGARHYMQVDAPTEVAAEILAADQR